MPQRTAQSGLSLPELPSMLRTEAGIVFGGAGGCDLGNYIGKSCVLGTKLNLFRFIASHQLLESKYITKNSGIGFAFLLVLFF